MKGFNLFQILQPRATDIALMRKWQNQMSSLVTTTASWVDVLPDSNVLSKIDSTSMISHLASQRKKPPGLSRTVWVIVRRLGMGWPHGMFFRVAWDGILGYQKTWDCQGLQRSVGATQGWQSFVLLNDASIDGPPSESIGVRQYASC
jgi:hypothetical protein